MVNLEPKINSVEWGSFLPLIKNKVSFYEDCFVYSKFILGTRVFSRTVPYRDLGLVLRMGKGGVEVIYYVGLVVKSFKIRSDAPSKLLFDKFKEFRDMDRGEGGN